MKKKDEPDNVIVTTQNIIGDYQWNGNPGSSKYSLRYVICGIKGFGQVAKDLALIRLKALQIKRQRQFISLE